MFETLISEALAAFASVFSNKPAKSSWSNPYPIRSLSGHYNQRILPAEISLAIQNLHSLIACILHRPSVVMGCIFVCLQVSWLPGVTRGDPRATERQSSVTYL